MGESSALNLSGSPGISVAGRTIVSAQDEAQLLGQVRSQVQLGNETKRPEHDYEHEHEKAESL